MEVDLVVPHAEPGAALQHARHPVPHAAHDARVEKVENPRGEWQLAELESNPRPLQSLLGGGALYALPRPSLRRTVGGLGKMTIHMALQHSLKLNHNYI